MMQIDERGIFKDLVNNVKLLIDRNIYKFLFTLLYYIFIIKEKPTLEEFNNLNNNKKDELNQNEQNFKNLGKKIDDINDKYIENKNEKLTKEYSSGNLINIIKFVKTQNNIYASEILENILIIVFSFGFKTKRENAFGKYIYNNISELKGKDKYILADWIMPKKIKTMSNIKDLLENDFLEEENMKSEIQKEPLYDFLSEIYREKEFKKKVQRKKIMNYINNRIFDFQNKIIQIINANKDKTQNKMDSYSSISTYAIVSDYFYKDNSRTGENIPIGKIKKIPIPLIRSFLTSVYIYYQNKHSKLMKYIKNLNNEENLEEIPFVYDLSEAAIENRFSGIIMSPLRIEPRINEIRLYKNILRENGILEFAKVLIFNNKSIKKVNFSTDLLKDSYIDFLNNRLGLFENNSIEFLNLSFNYLNESCSEYLANILSHLKKLKTINLSSNDLKSGISSFLITLKKLYRQRKTNLETLYLNKCLLDDIAYYELGELLKCKYCKLKNLYLNRDNIPSCSNFLKQLKKNRSLTQIYFNRSNICNNDTDDIMRVMSNTNIESLYLYQNKINDFYQLLRIIYRTKLVTKKEINKKENNNENNNNENNINENKKDNQNENNKIKIFREDSILYNLDLSINVCYNKNKDKLELLKQSIEDTTLYCLDISQILYNNFPGIFKKCKLYSDFMKNWNEELESNKKKYNKIIGDINFNEIDRKRIIKKIGNYNIDLFKEIDDDIMDIIKNDKAKYILFLRKKAEELINESDKIQNEIINNDENNKEKYKEIHSKLVDYMNLKRTDIALNELNEMKNEKKLILI